MHARVKHADVLRVRTSDRITFRRCRRKWHWSSGLRSNLEPKQRAAPLWTGSGVHFALEDYHGERHFESASQAFREYAKATKATRGINLPDDWREQVELGCGMLDFYTDEWLQNRDPLQTYVMDGRPQVEVRFEIPLPLQGPNGEVILYQGTLDRVIIDEHGQLWIVEYKTAKSFQLAHFDVDDQCTSYCWAGTAIYNKPIQGVIYQQHKKSVPDEPAWLASKRFSTNKQQATTHSKYRDALLNLYGSIEKAPSDNVEFLNYLTSLETEDSDQFVRRDRVYRNEHSIAAQGEKILLELEDMLNPDLPLYPNPTRDCSWDCPFMTACISLDDGSDWQFELDQMQQRERMDDRWRNKLQLPSPQPLVVNPPRLPSHLHSGLRPASLEPAGSSS